MTPITAQATSLVEDKLHEIERALSVQGDQHLDFLAQEDTIRRILELKEQKNALILGHNYMAPLVYQISGKEARGDSLALSMHAAKADNPIILFDGVRFMAETAKILNPSKKVLIADLKAGCSLADNFKLEDILKYKKKFPGIPVVTYVNSYADVKAESDYCCTSGNALEVVVHAAKESGRDMVLFFPDTFMGENLQRELYSKRHLIELIYPGKYDKKKVSCEVHEKITPEQIRNIRKQYNLVKGSKDSAVLVHLECPPGTIAEADYAGSTFGMIKYLRDHPELRRVHLGTECEMTANLQSEFPQKEFVKTCQISCQHMGRITLEKIFDTLRTETPEVNIPEDIRKRALIPIERMLAIGRG